MQILQNIMYTIVAWSLVLVNISCAPNQKAPISKDITKATFQHDWEHAVKNYTNSLDDTDGNMPGDDGGQIGETIQQRQKYSPKYSIIERYVDSIAHESSIVIRIFNEKMLYNQHFRSSTRDSLIRLLEDSVLRNQRKIPYKRTNSSGRTDIDSEILGNRRYYLDSTLILQEVPSTQTLFHYRAMTMQEPQCGGVPIDIHLNYSNDSVDCFWLVKNSDNVLHILYLTPKGKIKDDIIPINNELESALQSLRLWKQSRQVSIPNEKKYGTILSYWDTGNSYHVFFPWMWNDDDCANGWRCTTKDTSINAFHSALQKILCKARQNDVFQTINQHN